MKNFVASKSIERSILLTPKPLLQRLYVVPFIVLYVLWAMGFTYLMLVLKETPWWLVHREFYLIPLFLIGLCHFLLFMSRFWNLRMRALLDYNRCEKVSASACVLLEPREHRGKSAFVPIIHHHPLLLTSFFVFQQQKYLYDADKNVFSKPRNQTTFLVRDTIAHEGLSKGDYELKLQTIGANKFNIPVPTFWDLFQEHAVAPFFVFQVFCVGLWCLDDYWYFSLFTLFMLGVFESTVVYQRLRNIKDFQTMSVPSIPVQVRRDGQWMDASSIALVPGDLCRLRMDSEELFVPADLLLISGTCIVNEAMLSGESIPLLKEPINVLSEDWVVDFDQDRSQIVFGGTKVLQHSGDYLECIVINTGFSTVQGKLVRMMMFSSGERISANSVESFLFIGFLMIFAVAASVYVLIKGAQDEERSRYKLLVECALIITAVVPPELPMELSLAVNASLLSLSRLAIFCMEPFRIPFAGKVDVCCFDKTGTLTSDVLIVDSIVPLGEDNEEARQRTKLVLAGCHSLFRHKDKVLGDPMEKASIEYAKADLVDADAVTCRGETLHIMHRFPFSSALKRMSTVVSHQKQCYAVVKGAPETIQSMLSNVPADYEMTYRQLARSGSRVIALACKKVPEVSAEKARKLARDVVESGLQFAGFLCLRCPIKPDSKGALAALLGSKHHVVMITGDNYLTAVHTARELKLATARLYIIDDVDDKLVFLDYETDKSVAESDVLANGEHHICLNGDAITTLLKGRQDLIGKLERRIMIFSRASPSQKEDVLAFYKALGHTTLMCGDGTNDVGALKQAHVGIALLDGKPEDKDKILREMRLQSLRKQKAELDASIASFKRNLQGPAAKKQEELMDKMAESFMAPGEDGPTFQLGDASVAAPFSSRINTVESVCHIIRQGRCTLVTTLQMYKILAVNSLISAYGLSVLNLKGVRYGDFQATISGLMISACFMFLTKAEPVKKLSPKRPHTNIFNAYLLLSVMGQFGVHIASLFAIVHYAETFEFKRAIDPKQPFEPGLVNSCVFILSMLMQVSTFVINYQGRPFRESLWENKPLRTSLLIVGLISVITAAELYPELNAYLQIVPLPDGLRRFLLSTMSLNWLACYGIEMLAWRLFY